MEKQTNIFNLTRDKSKTPDRSIPKSIKLKRKEYWCPYCSIPVVFIKDKNLGVKRCPFCEISDREYNVKLVNKIWK